MLNGTYFRYLIEVQYEGTAFHGSQIQGAQQTVQGALNNALSIVLRQPISTLGASRTDEGVHAQSNFYHFDYSTILSSKLIYSLNAILPQSLAVKALYRFKDQNANARFDAIKRSYRYRICFRKNPFTYQRAYLFPYTINHEVLIQSAQMILQHQEFESFCKKNSQNKTFKCQIFESTWEQYPEELHYVVSANRFLRGMVRALVGTQLRLARGQYTLQEFEQILHSKNTSKTDFSVPGFGLYLEAIHYPEGLFEPII